MIRPDVGRMKPVTMRIVVDARRWVRRSQHLAAPTMNGIVHGSFVRQLWSGFRP
jgi:hypothetical protein